MICSTELIDFSLVFFLLSTSSFSFLFFSFYEPRIRARTRNRRHSTCIIIIIRARYTASCSKSDSTIVGRLRRWDETVWRGWVGPGNNASFNRRLISKGWLKAPSRPHRRGMRSRNCIGGPATDVGMTGPTWRRAMRNRRRRRRQLNLNTPLNRRRYSDGPKPIVCKTRRYIDLSYIQGDSPFMLAPFLFI